jgi:tellurite resistance protein TerC
VWIVTLVVAVAFLAVDVFIVGRRPHEPSMREVTRDLAFFIGAALLFCAGILVISGPEYAAQFLGGWLTEYSLSIDNLFVFLVIIAKLKVPRELQQHALLVGIVLALILRGVFIAVGAAAISAFSWIFYLFGAFLLYTAVKLAVESKSEQNEYHESRAVQWLRRRVPSTKNYHGTKLTVKRAGKRLVTPMLLVIVALGTTDLLFALDSIPAIYGITQEPYLVLTANIFALMGLRQLCHRRLVPSLAVGASGSRDIGNQDGKKSSRLCRTFSSREISPRRSTSERDLSRGVGEGASCWWVRRVLRQVVNCGFG